MNTTDTISPDNTPIQATHQPATLVEFLALAVTGSPDGDVWVKFKNPITGERPFDRMRGNFSHGHYELSKDQLLAGEELAAQIIQIATAKGVDIRLFSDVQQVMGFDINPRELSKQELGAYLIGQALANHTSLGTEGFQSYLKPVFRMASSQLSIELGRQVFGDNFPDNSATDTLTEASMDAVKDAAKSDPDPEPQ